MLSKKISIIVLVLILLFSSAMLIWGYFQAQQNMPTIGVEQKVKPALPEYHDNLGKLIYLLDQYKKQSLTIFIDGRTYNGSWASRFGSHYLKQFYQDASNPEIWIKEHTYRSKKGNIIYFQYEDGTQKPMRDVMLEDLRKLNDHLRPQ